MMGIYKIQSKIYPDRCYIGSAMNIFTRFSVHKCLLKKNKHHSIILQRHYNKHGLIDLFFDVVQEMPFATKKELEEKEKFYFTIFKYKNSKKPYLNVSSDTRSRRGVKSRPESIEKSRQKNLGRKPWNTGLKLSDEHKAKLREAHKGQVQSEESNKKRAESLRGRKHTEESKRKMSESLKGKYPMTQEMKEILGKINVGNKYALGNKSRSGLENTPEHNEKLRNANLGKTHSEETKEKIRLSKLGKKLAQEHKDKISKALMGREVSEEFRLKMSIIRRKTIEDKKLKETGNAETETT